MIIDFTTVLTDQDNKPLQDLITMQSNGEIPVELTLGRASAHALNYQSQDEANLAGDEKFRRGMLAFEVRDNNKCDLKVEDIALIKKQLAKLFTPTVIYRAYNILDV